MGVVRVGGSAWFQCQGGGLWGWEGDGWEGDGWEGDDLEGGGWEGDDLEGDDLEEGGLWVEKERCPPGVLHLGDSHKCPQDRDSFVREDHHCVCVSVSMCV